MGLHTILISFTLAVFFFACTDKPYALTPKLDQTVHSSYTVFVASHGWHTGFILPAKTLDKDFPFLAKRFKNPLYYEIGWGDKGFYQANEITTGITLQAVFWPTESVVHIVSVPSDPLLYFANSEVIELQLSEEKFYSLKRFIASSFKYTKNNKVIKLKRGIYGDSQFYKGEGEYYLMNTCNKWTAKGLKSSGLPINPYLKLSSDSVMSFLKSTKQNKN